MSDGNDKKPPSPDRWGCLAHNYDLPNSNMSLNCNQGRRKIQRRESGTFIRNVNGLSRDIVDASFDPLFVIDEFGIILMLNNKAVEVFGWSREEFLGKNISMIVGGGHAETHDQYLERYLRTGERRVIGRRRTGLTARKKDGSEFPVELGIREMERKPGSLNSNSRRHFCGFLRDLTAETRHEKELAYKQRLSDGIVNASFDAMVAIDQKGKIIRANEAAVRQHGYSMDELIGSNISMLCGGVHGKNHDKYLRRYLKTGEKRVIGVKRELCARRKNGEEFPVELGIKEIQTVEGESIFCGFIRDLTESKRCVELEIENSKAETLLLNMLPQEIAARLKRDPSHIADQHSNVSILFGDIVGFTELSSRLAPDRLVRLLNELFSKFDAIVEKYDLNKVKTIGDCYMVTSHPNMINQVTECKLMCKFALDMMKAVGDYNSSHPELNLSLRVGINTGSVVAGVVGTKRFLYDIWGDAVNIASRMESTGVAGKIQVTEAVVEASKDSFIFESRGEIDVKGKGKLQTFFLTGKRTHKRKISMEEDTNRRRSSTLVESDDNSSHCPLRQLLSTKKYFETKLKEIDVQICQNLALKEISDDD